MGRAPEKNRVNDDGIFTDVDPESVRIPTTNRLNRGKICTCFSKGSRATRPKGVASDVLSKERTKPRDIPVASRNVEIGRASCRERV